MGFKVSNKVKAELEVAGETLTHVFMASKLDKAMLKALKVMIGLGINLEGNKEQFKNPELLDILVGMYDKSIDHVIGYEVDDGGKLRPVEHVPLMHKIEVMGGVIQSRVKTLVPAKN